MPQPGSRASAAPPRVTKPRRGLRWRALVSALSCIGAIVLGAIGFAALAALKQPPGERQPEPRVFNVEVFDVHPADLREIVTGFGTARAEREVAVAAQVAGEVVEIHPRLKVGERVSAGASSRDPGTLLLSIDRAVYEELAAQAQLKLREDQAELDRLEQEEANTTRTLAKVREDHETFQREQYEPVRLLVERKAASAIQLSQALLELRRYEDAILEAENRLALIPRQRKQIEARMESQRAASRLAELDLERTRVHPPFSGVLGEVFVERGQYVGVGESLVRITDVDQVEVPVPVPLDEYAKFSHLIGGGAGDPSYPRVRLAANETAPPRWTGTLVRAAPVADETTRTIMVYVRVDNRDQPAPLLPGTFVHARIDGPAHRRALFIPRDALLGDRVLVARDGLVEERRVRVLRTLRDLALVADDDEAADAGIRPGDRLVLTNLDVLRTGSQIRVQSHSTLADVLEAHPVPTVLPLAEAEAADVP
ncbi:MAG: efflux RND transporter periplasmic adaptor subunit [Planctomycetaceae bacterium]